MLSKVGCSILGMQLKIGQYGTRVGRYVSQKMTKNMGHPLWTFPDGKLRHQKTARTDHLSGIS